MTETQDPHPKLGPALYLMVGFPVACILMFSITGNETLCRALLGILLLFHLTTFVISACVFVMIMIPLLASSLRLEIRKFALWSIEIVIVSGGVTFASYWVWKIGFPWNRVGMTLIMAVSFVFVLIGIVVWYASLRLLHRLILGLLYRLNPFNSRFCRLIATDNYDAALKMVASDASLQRIYGNNLLEAGRRLMAAGRLDDGHRFLQQGVMNMKRETNSLVFAANVYYDYHQLERGQNLVSEAVEKVGDKPEVLLIQCQYLAASHQLKEAMEIWQRFHNLDDHSIEEMMNQPAFASRIATLRTDLGIDG